VNSCDRQDFVQFLIYVVMEIKHFYKIDSKTLGFFYVPYMGSHLIQGTLECSVSDLGEGVIIHNSKTDCYSAVSIEYVGEIM